MACSMVITFYPNFKSCMKPYSLNLKNGDNYRNGNNSLEKRNLIHTHSSRTDQASEITMTPAYIVAQYR